MAILGDLQFWAFIVVPLFTAAVGWFLSDWRQRRQLKSDGKAKSAAEQNEQALAEIKDIKAPITTADMIGNPYIVGPHIAHPSNFYGRAEELQTFFSDVMCQQMRSICVVGARRSGKTSFLHYVSDASVLERYVGGRAARILPVYITLQGVVSPAQCYARMAEATLHALERQRRTGAQRSLSVAAPDFDYLFRLTRTCYENHWEVWYLFDEFDAALEAPAVFDRYFFGSLRSLITQRDAAVAFVLSAGIDPRTLPEPGARDKKTSPLFNTFAASLYLGAFTEIDARQLVYQPAARAGLEFRTEEIDAVIAEAGLLPFQLQAAAAELFQARTNRLPPGNLLETMRTEYRAFIEPQFGSYWEHFSADEKAALKAPGDPVRAPTLERLRQYGFARPAGGGRYAVLGAAFADFVAAAA